MHLARRNILAAKRTHNYELVPSITTARVIEDINIGAVISRALKLAVTRSKMLFVPKQRGRHLLALPRHSQSMSKVPPLFGTAVCCFYWIRSSEMMEAKCQNIYLQWRHTSETHAPMNGFFKRPPSDMLPLEVCTAIYSKSWKKTP